MRRSLSLIAVTVLSLVAAAPASAGSATVPNACYFAFNKSWQDFSFTYTATGTPAPAAPGSGVTLTAGSVYSRIPDWVTEFAVSSGILMPGPQELPIKIWLALAGDNTAQGVQVLELDAVARTTVTAGPDGTLSATPMEVTVPMPDTVWTAGATGTAGFRQAGPGTLPPIPGGLGGAMLTPRGSVYIKPVLPGGLHLAFDCQPGRQVNERTAFEAAAAGPFESVTVQPGATVVPAPKPVPAVALRTAALKAQGRKVKVALSCTAADCRGALTLKSGSRTVARKAYTVRSGARGTVTLTLTRLVQRSLKAKRKLKVELQVTATGGKTLTRTLTLR